MKKTLGLLAGVALLVVAGLPAKAAVVTTNLDIDHCTGTCGLTNYGTVTATDNGTGGVAFDIELIGGAALQFAGQGLSTFLFSAAGTSLTAANFSAVSGYAPVIPAGHQDGFGDFGYGFNHDQPPAHDGTSLMFTVSNLTVAALTASIGGSPSVLFAVDIFGPNGKTGLVGGNTGTQFGAVPIPGALPLFAGGLGGLVLLMRRKKKVAQVAA